MITVVLSILIVVVIIAIVILRKSSKPQRKPTILYDPERKQIELENELEKKTEKLKDEGVPEEILECRLIPDLDGNCPLSIVKKDDNGCCTIFVKPEIMDMIPEMALGMLKTIGKLVFAIFVGVAFETIVIGIPKILLNSKFLTKVAAGVTQEIAKGTIKVGARQTLRNSARLMTRAMMQAMAKVAASTTFKVIGWALIAVEVASLLLDIFDPSGFSAFIPNEASRATRDQILTNMIVSIPKKSYPPVFSAAIAFPDMFKIALVAWTTELLPRVMQKLTEDHLSTIQYAMESAESNDATAFDNPIVMSLLEDTMALFINITPVERDTFIYNKMISMFKDMGIKGEEKIELHTELSTEERYAITITEDMAEEWNKKYWEKWKNHNYTSETEDPPPMVAVYTDKYIYINEKDPGKNVLKPNLIEKKLKKKVALAFPYGQIIQHCENTKRYATYMGFGTNKNVQVNPYDYGVRFNPETGTCKYTEDYCDRVGLDYKSGGITDCDFYEGQEVAEMIFGTSLTRYSIIGANEIEEWAEGWEDLWGLL